MIVPIFCFKDFDSITFNKGILYKSIESTVFTDMKL